MSEINKGWLDWAFENGIEPEIISYIMIKPDYLWYCSDIGDQFASPRSWTFADQWLKIFKTGRISYSDLRNILIGCVGIEVGYNFWMFMGISSIRVRTEDGNYIPITDYTTRGFMNSLVGRIVLYDYKPDLCKILPEKYPENESVEINYEGKKVKINVMFRKHEIAAYVISSVISVILNNYREWQKYSILKSIASEEGYNVDEMSPYELDKVLSDIYTANKEKVDKQLNEIIKEKLSELMSWLTNLVEEYKNKEECMMLATTFEAISWQINKTILELKK